MRFAVISDPHIVVPGTVQDGTWWYKTLYSCADRRYNSIIRSLQEINPDFVAVCGDFTGDTRKESFQLGTKLMDQIACDWMTAVGNHDTNWPGVREEVARYFGLPEHVNYQVHNLSDGEDSLHFIFLDLCCHLWRDGTIRYHIDDEAYQSGDILKFGINEEQLSWLEDELASRATKSTILITHTPVYYKDSVYVGTLPKGECRYDAEVTLNTLNPELEQRSADALKKLINRYSKVIAAVFSGHTHIHEVIYRHGIPFCTTGALREWPFEFRVADVHQGVMHVTTVGLDDPLLSELSYEAWRNNDWIKGTSVDREFSVQLRDNTS